MRNPRNVLLVVTLLAIGAVILLILLLQASVPTTGNRPATGRVRQFDPQQFNVGTETPTSDLFITWSAQMEDTDVAATGAAPTQAATP